MKYFFKQFIIYTLLLMGFTFLAIEDYTDNLSGTPTKSSIEFVYQGF